MRILAILAPLSLSVFLFGPALRARFLYPNLFVYILPMVVFLAVFGIISIMRPAGIFRRIVISLFLVLPLIPCYLAWFNGEEQFRLLITVAINCALGMMIVVYPWDTESLDRFMLFCAGLGAIIAVNSMMYYGSYDALQNASEFTRTNYLSVALAAGLSCLASLYLVAKNFSLVYLALFVVNWIGLALSRGRGAVIVCAVITVVYLLILLLSRVSTLTRIKKLLIIVGAISFTPYIISRLLLLNQGRWNRLLFEIHTEIDVGQRGYLMSIAIEKILAAPIIGHGLGAYRGDDNSHPHNIILQYGVDSGMIGIGILLFFFIFIVKKCIESIRFCDQVNSNLALAITSLFVFTIGNFLKSGDAYLGRDWIVLSAIALGAYCAFFYSSVNTRDEVRE